MSEPELYTESECPRERIGVPVELRIPELERTEHGKVVTVEINPRNLEGITYLQSLETEEAAVPEPVGAGLEVVADISGIDTEPRV